MIPSYGVSLMENPELLDEITASTNEILRLNEINESAEILDIEVGEYEEVIEKTEA
jgi:malate dehydrogenase (quinone)